MSASASISHRPRTERSPESFDSLNRRNIAAEILQSYEQLSWWSTRRKETLNKTRTHFQNVLAGFTSKDEDSFVDWPMSYRPISEHTNERAKSGDTGKGKERLSLTAGSSSKPAPAVEPKSSSSKKKRKTPGRA